MTNRSNPLLDVLNVIIESAAIRKDEQRRQKFIRFAVTAIIQSVLMVVFAAGGSYLLRLILEANNDAIMLFLFTLVGTLVCLLGAAIMLIAAGVRVICQLTINRKAISWIALVLYIAAIAVSLVVLLAL